MPRLPKSLRKRIRRLKSEWRQAAVAESDIKTRIDALKKTYYAENA